MRSARSFTSTTPSSRPRAEVAAAPDARRWLTAILTLALFGATLGPASDAVHVHTGTTAYAHPVLFGQAWWVPPLFASASVAIGLGRPLAARLLGRTGRAISPAIVAQGMALFVTGYVASGLVGEQPWLCSALLAALFVVGWLRCDGSSVGLLLAALTAIGGRPPARAAAGPPALPP